jgi:protein-disulfide isomerase
LIYVQLFLIHGLCIFCLSLYAINFGAFILLLYGQAWSIKKIIRSNIELLSGKGLSVVSLLAIALAALFIAVPVTVGIRNYHRAQLSKTLAARSDGETKAEKPGEIIPSREETVEKLYKNLAKTKVDLRNSYFIGDPNGPVRIAEFSDFRCPACREKTKIFKKLLNVFPRGVGLYFKNFPIDKACIPELGSEGHEYSCLAAKTTHCAGKQGQFWVYHDQVFANQERVSPGFLNSISKSLKLNEKELNDCIAKEGSEKVLKDIAEARSLGVNSTPTLFVNDRKIDQTFTIDKFYTLITLILKQETGRADYPSWEDVEFELLGSLYD